MVVFMMSFVVTPSRKDSVSELELSIGKLLEEMFWRL